MSSRSRTLFLLILLVLFLLGLLAIDLSLGSIRLGIGDILAHIFGSREMDGDQLLVLTSFRLPRILTALMAGAALPVCGLQMQTLFRNPLAGPYVLGISSGASFGAALIVLGTGAAGLVATWTLAGAAWIGAALVMLLLLAVSYRVRDVMTLLILGVMFSSGLAALISVMQYFSPAASLKSFIIWSMGSLGNVNGQQLTVMLWVILPLLLLSLLSARALNGMMLGEEYATSMGISVQRTRLIVLTTTSLLAGTITAFCGPIGFIGIAVPHMVRFLFARSDHRFMLPVTMLTGMVVLLLSDVLSRLPGEHGILPINALTSLLGIPVVILVIMGSRKTRMF